MSSDLTVKVNSVGRAVQLYQAAVEDFDRETARILGVNSTDLRCLEILTTEPDEEITPRTIAARLRLTTGSVTTMLDRLEQAGYIIRTRHAIDKRKVLVRATSKVQERVRALIGPLVEEGEAEIIAGFSPDELDIVERFITRATALQQRHTTRLHEWTGRESAAGTD
ncbi:MarR family winged helix-turn-helix transcriptional regulator [Arthrobacter caoxuetaonis]|uniref:MarR family transcriptional regulator n=1 Tax=Arthrobacter caoxuetaonis TaxID=2886935 RepID=A0A9X1MG71_9MICC|nr:MarR family transcriptional regulator [Arthrobacter caoxuetaonis]MCC3299226.1 MarR family transcriptional regulator [Arthrobacter caoxuetaonis]USQ58451.1 MarR family transcriptional regulator [Arthrobacter caoxuetaonis]